MLAKVEAAMKARMATAEVNGYTQAIIDLVDIAKGVANEMEDRGATPEMVIAVNGIIAIITERLTHCAAPMIKAAEAANQEQAKELLAGR